MRLRTAVPTDSQALAEVHIATWKSAYAGIVSQAYLDSLSVALKKIRWDGILGSGREKEVTLVAELEGCVVGFISVGPNRDPGLEFEAEIYALYLYAHHQRRGIGAALMEAGRAAATNLGFRSLCVWVLRDNPSRGFYAKMGGRLLKEKEIRIGEQDLPEVAYGWDVGLQATSTPRAMGIG